MSTHHYGKEADGMSKVNDSRGTAAAQVASIWSIGFKSRLWIDGKWYQAVNGRTTTVRDPATRETVAEVPYGGEAETLKAVEAAVAAFSQWRKQSPNHRAEVLWRIYHLLLENREALALLSTVEGGTPIAQTRGFVDYAAGFFRFFAEEARRIYGRTIAHPDPNRRLRVEYYPVGVVGAITPWNVPLAAPAKKVAAALAAGCAIVLKPASLTPLSALALAHLCDKAGLPAGVLNVVFGDTKAIGQVLLDHPEVPMIACTGSIATGQHLMREAAKQIKKVTLELGGNAPFIVFADADVEQAAADLVWLKSLNSGQICVTANRMLVQREVHDRFVSILQDLLSKQKVGSGLDPETTFGPLISREALDGVAALVEGAIAEGATLICGGRTPPPGPGECLYPPTLLDGVTPSMRIANEEIFGPVLPIIRFDSEEEALRVANDSPYGLSAFVYTRDMARAQRMADGLEAGVIGINDPRPHTPDVPFGGVKRSGIGREGGTEGLLEYLEPRLIGTRFTNL